MRFLTVPALFVAGALVVSCDSPTMVEEATAEGILLMGNSGEPKGLDPHLVSGVLESNILAALFEGLCKNHPSKDGVALPGAALRWTPNDDFSVWTFDLNPEARWSDNVPVTAQDFVFAYHRLLDPDLPAKYADMLFLVENAETINKDLRSFVLLGNLPGLPIDPEALKRPPFQPDPDAAGDAAPSGPLATLPAEARRRRVRAAGLDGLGPGDLETVLGEPALVAWPAGFTPALRTRALELLLEYARKHDDGTHESLASVLPLGARALDEWTLEITLRGPVPFLPEVVKHYTWFPVPRHVIRKWSGGDIDLPFTDWTDPGNLVGNGPFRLKEWRVNHYIEVERNPHYWDARRVSLNGIRFLPVQNAYTEARMFLDGQLHVTYTLPPEMIPYARTHIPEMLRQEPYIGTRFLRVNVRRKPLDDPRVRHALAATIDRRRLVENVLGGGQTPASGIVPPFSGYKLPQGVGHDPERARRLLAEAGFPNGRGFPELKFLTVDRDTARRMAEAYMSMWEEHLGIHIRIEQREWTTYLQRQYDGDYQLAGAAWIGDFLYPTTFLDMWTRNNGNNNTGWWSPAYESKLREAEHTADPAAKLALLKDAETILLDELPAIPVYWYTTNYLVRPEVRNWRPLLLNHHPYKFVELVAGGQ